MSDDPGTSDEQGTEDFIDPTPSRRLSRKSMMGVGLAAAGVVLVLFFSSRGGRQDGRPRPTPISEPVIYGEVDPIDVSVESPVPPPPPPPPENPWARTPSPSQWSASESGEDVEAERQLFDLARQAVPVLYESLPETERGDKGRDERQDADPDMDGMQDFYRDALAPLSALVGGAPRDPPPGPPGWVSTTTGTPVGYGAYVVRQGTVIHAALETSLNSDRPGPVIARVVRPVRESQALRHVLIPAGTKLIGGMQNTPPGFRGGVVVAWTRMQLSDGRVVDLPGFPSTETTGGQGVAEKVDKHRMGRFGGAALLALMGASTTFATASAANSATGLAGAALGVELARMGSATATKRIARPATVTVSPGYRFLIYVSDDIHFSRPSAM